MARSLHPVVVWLFAAVVFLAACGGHAATAVTTSAPAVAAPTVVPATPTTAPTPNAIAASAATAATTASSQAATASTASGTGQAAPTATPVPVIPVKVAIPAIGVTAPVELVGLTSDGAMDVPKQWNDVGWYKYGPIPGTVGNAAMAGHLDSTIAPAVFSRLGSLNAGDKVLVTLSNGTTVTFVVKQKVSYPYDAAPIAQVFGPANTANLNLITCGGSWDAFTKNYSNRIVVYTTKA
jgi:LPXTG-site transpeptidase (sortase) family protein